MSGTDERVLRDLGRDMLALIRALRDGDEAGQAVILDNTDLRGLAVMMAGATASMMGEMARLYGLGAADVEAELQAALRREGDGAQSA